MSAGGQKRRSMDSRIFMQGIFFFARARTRIYRSAIISSLCWIFSSIPAAAQDSQFIFGQDSRIHGILLDRSPEEQTRQKMNIAEDCQSVKSTPSAMALVGS